MAGVGLYDMRVMVLLRFGGATRMNLGGSWKRDDRELMRLAVAERRRRGMEAILSGERERERALDFL